MNGIRGIRAVLFCALLGTLTWVVSAREVGPVRQGRSLDDADPNATRSVIQHDIGNLRMTLSNFGVAGNPDLTPGYHGFEWPINSGNNFLFSAGIWVGAVRGGVSRVSTTTDGDNGTEEFYPWHIGTLPMQNPSADWFVTSSSVPEYQGRSYVMGAKSVDDDADWMVSRDDRDHNGVPSANWDLGSGFIGIDDDGDGIVDEDRVEVDGQGIPHDIDGDNDGNVRDTDHSGDHNNDGDCGYDPESHIDEDPAGDISHDRVDNDYDGLVDMADPDYDGDLNPGFQNDDNDGWADEDGIARGVQEYYADFQDSISAPYIRGRDSDGHVPLEIEINQRSLAWPGAMGQDVVLIEYLIRNAGATPLDNVYLALFADPDIARAGETGDEASLHDGNYFDSSRVMALQGKFGFWNGADTPGIFAMRVLRTPVALNQLRTTFANFERVSGGDPVDDADKYSLISSGVRMARSAAMGDWRFVIGFGQAATNGFHLEPDSVLPITVAYLSGTTVEQVNDNAARALALAYMASVPLSPASPVNLQLVSTSFETVVLAWSPPRFGTASGYDLFGIADGGHGTRMQFNTSLILDTTFTVTGLQNGSDWLMQCQTLDDSGHSSLPAELLVRVAAPATVTGLGGETAGGLVTLHWNENHEANLAGYRVLRRDDTGDSTSVATTATTFMDISPRRGHVNTYWVVAENHLGVLSFSGASLEFIPFAPQQRVLLLNDCGFTTAAAGGVSQDSVRRLYQRLVGESSVAMDYCDQATCLTVDSLTRYDVVVWANDNRNDANSSVREPAFQLYLQGGGKLVRIARRFLAADLSMPEGWTRSSPPNLVPLTFDSVRAASYHTNQPGMQFVGATSAIAGFPSVSVDTARVHEIRFASRTYDYLPEVDILMPRGETQPLYRTQVLAQDSSGLSDLPCAVIGSQMIVLTFPLYFLHYADAQAILMAAIDTLRNMPISGTDQPDPVPRQFALKQNYPNPFNPSTTISFELVTTAKVELKVYNILGEEVAKLADGVHAAGVYQVNWDGSTNSGSMASSGVYLYQLRAGDRIETRKMLLLR